MKGCQLRASDRKLISGMSTRPAKVDEVHQRRGDTLLHLLPGCTKGHEQVSQQPRSCTPLQSALHSMPIHYADTVLQLFARDDTSEFDQQGQSTGRLVQTHSTEAIKSHDRDLLFSLFSPCAHDRPERLL